MAQGFKPGSAALHMASGGTFGFVKNLFAPKSAAPKAPAPDGGQGSPPPASPPPTAPAPNTIAGYAGMTAMQRREKEAGLKNGGDLRTGQGGHVPGTGSGDKIPAKYEPGEFVVSNDMLEANPGMREQLHAAREMVLAAQGRTPAQADSKNAGVIAKLAAKTRSEQPSLGFVAGGAIDYEQKRLAAQSAMYVEGAQAKAATNPQPAPAALPAKPTVQPQPTSTGFMPGARAVMAGVGNDVSGNIKAGNYAQAAGNATRGALAMVPAVADDVVGGFGRGAYNLAAKPVQDFGRAVVGSPANAAEVPAKPATMPVAPATVASPVANGPEVPTDVQRGGTTPGPISSLASSAQVTRTGNSYSGGNVAGDITINGLPPRRGGAISEQNMAAADALAARSQARDSIPVGPGRQAMGFQPPVVLSSANDWQKRNDLRNLEVSASSITAQGSPGRPSAAQAAYKNALEQDTQARYGADAGSVNNATQAGANQRAGMTEAGANQRAGEISRLAQQRLGLDTQEFGLKQTAAGFQSRAARQLEDAQSAFANAKTDVEREKAQNTLRALQGKYEKAAPELWDKVQTGVDPRTNAPIYSLYNKRTGESPGQKALPVMDKNSEAIAIRDNSSMSREQKVEALRRLGYQG